MRGTGVSADVLPSGAIVLTTTLDGLWVLQVLSGIESLAPELGLRPVLPSAEPRGVRAGPPDRRRTASGRRDQRGRHRRPRHRRVAHRAVPPGRRTADVHLHAGGQRHGGCPARPLRPVVGGHRTSRRDRPHRARRAPRQRRGSAIAVIRGQIERLLGTLEPRRSVPRRSTPETLVAHVTSPDTPAGILDGSAWNPSRSAP